MIRAARLAWAIPLCALLVKPATAQETTATTVRVYVAGGSDAVAKARATLQELFDRLALQAVVESASDETALSKPAPDTLATGFLDFRSKGGTRVVLRQRPSGRELERRTLPTASSLEVAVEEAAHVVYMAVASSLRATDLPAASAADAVPPPDRAPAEAAPAPASTPPSAAAPPTSSVADSAALPADGQPTSREPSPPRAESTARPATETRPEGPHDTSRVGPPSASQAASHGGPLAFEGGVSAFGAVSSFETTRALPGIGGALDAVVGAAALRMGATLSLGTFFPTPVSSSAEGSLRSDSVRLVATAQWFVVPRVAFVVGAGGGADRITFDPGVSTSSVTATGPRSRVDPVLQAVAGARCRVTEHFGAFALAAADVDLTPHRYQRDQDGELDTFFTLPRVRPGAFIGLSYQFHDATFARASKERSP